MISKQHGWSNEWLGAFLLHIGVSKAHINNSRFSRRVRQLLLTYSKVTRFRLLVFRQSIAICPDFGDCTYMVVRLIHVHSECSHHFRTLMFRLCHGLPLLMFSNGADDPSSAFPQNQIRMSPYPGGRAGLHSGLGGFLVNKTRWRTARPSCSMVSLYPPYDERSTLYSSDVMSPISSSGRLRTLGPSLISTPGPTGLEVLPLGKTCRIGKLSATWI